MSYPVYLNGKYVDMQEARISPLDRGFLFGDSIYEVIPVYNNQLFTAKEHLARLTHSLNLINMQNPLATEAWMNIFKQLLLFPYPGDRLIYIQVTRGAYAERAHASPLSIEPTIFVAALPVTRRDISKGLSVITRPDDRWARCHIKANTLLANVLAKDAAVAADTQDAIFIRDGFALEGTASNLFMVKNNEVVTPPLSANILPGITRSLVILLLRENNILVREEMITQEALQAADEIWLTGSVLEIASVTSLNQQKVGKGDIGPLYQQAILAYREKVRSHHD